MEIHSIERAFAARAPALTPTLPLWSAIPALLAILAYGFAARGGDGPGARQALPLAWVAHGTALLSHLFGIGEVGEGARFGFAPAVSTTVWLAVAVYAVESRFVPLAGVRRILAVLGVLSLVLLMAYPGTVHVHPTSPWAPLHWLLGLASYGLFGTAVLHALLLDRADRALKRRLPGTPANPSGMAASLKSPAGTGLPLLALEALTFRFVWAGFLVLTVAILLGVWFTSVWRWDAHKTVLSLMSWGVFAALLIGRRVFGWRGRRATRWVYGGTLLLLLAYVGTRFVFEVLLHRAPGGLA